MLTLLTITNLLLSQSLNTDINTCEAKIKLTNYTPSLCYKNYNHETCQDQCKVASPSLMKSCFSSINLPCSIKEQLYDNAKGKEQDNLDTWVHISDLISEASTNKKTYIQQQTIYQDLYREYIEAPAIEYISDTTLAQKKSQFRLNQFDAVTRITLPLNQAGNNRSLTLGEALAQDVDAELAAVFQNVHAFELFSDEEAQALNLELSQLSASRLLFWNLLNSISRDDARDSRIFIINFKLEQYISQLNTLVGRKFDLMLNKSLILNKVADFNIRPCEQTPSQACYTPMDNPSRFFWGDDQALNYVDEWLQLLNGELSAISISYDHKLNPGTALPSPNFATVMSEQVETYSLSPGHDALARMETAINIAFLQQNKTGEELRDALSTSPVQQVQGHTFLSSLPHTQPILCENYLSLDPQLEGINQESFALGQEAQAILLEMQSLNHTPAQLDRLNTIMARLQELVYLSQQLTGIDRFKDDRHINVIWHLNNENYRQLASRSQRIDIEYVEMDGMFWIPSMSRQLQQLFPSITGLYSIKGSLLPSGQGKISGTQSLTLSLTRSPYNACHDNLQDIKIVVTMTDDNGEKQRHLLVAPLTPFQS